MKFQYRLARDLKRTVRELQASMDSNEFVHWVAYYAMEAEERERAAREAKRRR